MHLFSQLNSLTLCKCHVSFLQGKGCFPYACSVCLGLCPEPLFIPLASLFASILQVLCRSDYMGSFNLEHENCGGVRETFYWPLLVD